MSRADAELSDHQITTLTREFLDAEQSGQPLIGELDSIDHVIQEFEGAPDLTLAVVTCRSANFRRRHNISPEAELAANKRLGLHKESPGRWGLFLPM
jgi:hypothetical protein